MHTSSDNSYDWVIFGAGIFGMYAAKILVERGAKIALVDLDRDPFQRASYVNQARLHLGFHYPRSITTAIGSLGLFERFYSEFQEAICDGFEHYYALGNRSSYTSASQFEKFCSAIGIDLFPVQPSKYFKDSTVEAVYKTNEPSFDAGKILKKLQSQMATPKNQFNTFFNQKVLTAVASDSQWDLKFEGGLTLQTSNVLNATYAGMNQIQEVFRFRPIQVKYELTEVALGLPSAELRGKGFTIMDGPFFSVLPFGQGPYYSLTSVQHTPHSESKATLPSFDCQTRRSTCSPNALANCNACPERPPSNFPYMKQLARKYLQETFDLRYEKSLFTVKTILANSEVDDGRPTLVQKFQEHPQFISVLSGKINTIFELEKFL